MAMSYFRLEVEIWPFNIMLIYVRIVGIPRVTENQCLQYLCLQCFDAVGWAAGRASDL